MKTTTNRAIKVGALVIFSLLLFVLAIYLIGSKNNLFNSKTYVYCSFKDIRGVVPGNGIRFSGINVGNVKDIEIESDSVVILTLAIRTNYARFIYRNSLVEITQDGLMGNKLLVISSGTPDMGAIQENDTLKAKHGIDIENMISQVRDILVDAKSAVANVNLLTAKINNGEGDIGELLTKKTLTTKLGNVTDNLNSTLTEVTSITKKINAGQGDLGKLVNSNEMTAEIKPILANLKNVSKKAEGVVDELQQTTKSINQGNGTLNLLLNNKKTANSIDTTIIKVNSGLDQFNHTAKAVEDSWILKIFNDKKKTKKRYYTHTPADSIK